MSKAISVECPAGVTLPKFQFFQKVRIGKSVGTIVGMSWVSIEHALISGYGVHGWEYTVSDIFGLPGEEILGAYDPVGCFFEYRLNPVDANCDEE